MCTPPPRNNRGRSCSERSSRQSREPAPTRPTASIQFCKSSYGDDRLGCVEVAVASDGGRWLRDTKDRATPAHYYPLD
ncbi:MAG: DUF397 domain-containing protein [Pseudonocardiaceae bacterium]